MYSYLHHELQPAWMWSFIVEIEYIIKGGGMTYLLIIVKLTDAVLCYTIHIYNDTLNANL